MSPVGLLLLHISRIYCSTSSTSMASSHHIWSRGKFSQIVQSQDLRQFVQVVNPPTRFSIAIDRTYACRQATMEHFVCSIRQGTAPRKASLNLSKTLRTDTQGPDDHCL